MKRTLAILAMLALPAAAHADSIMTTIDEVNFDYDHAQLTVTGIVSGETTPRVVSTQYFFTSNDTSTLWLLDHCLRAATMSMNRPGRYKFTIAVNNNWLSGCKLTRNQ